MGQGSLLSQGHQQSKHESAWAPDHTRPWDLPSHPWKAGAVLGEQGAGDRASWGVGRGAQTPRWTKLNKGKGRAAWESRAEVPSHHRAHPAFSPPPSFVSLHKPAPCIGSRTRPQTHGCLTQSHSSARRCRGLQEEQEATAQGPKPGWLRAAPA